MRNIKQVLLTVMVLTLSIGSSYQVLAANTAMSSSQLSRATSGGTVDAIYKDERNEIVISDQSFVISSTLVVRSISGQMLGGLTALSPGKVIAYRTVFKKVKGEGGEYLVEAWLLPAGFKFPEEWL